MTATSSPLSRSPLAPRRLRPLTLALALACLGGAVQGATPAGSAGPAGPSQPQPQPQPQPQLLNIPAQAAPQALLQLMEQTKLQLIYPSDLVRGVTTKAVSGSFTPMEALARMLVGTGLQAVETGVNAATIRATHPAPERGDKVVEALDTVLISATRRREPVREVPLQVAVVQAEALERSGAKGLADYLADQPGVNLADTGGVLSSLSIRGVTTGQQTVATVGVYVDDVATGSSSPYAAGAGTPLNMGLLDLHHIEFLRGPQGTLYGAGAMGGVLKYVTNEPDTSLFSGRVTLGASTTRAGGTGWTTSAVLNAPLKEDVAALRVAAFHDRFGGYIDAVGPAAGRDINRGKTEGARVSMLLTPTRGLTVRLSAMTQQVHREGQGLVDLQSGTGQALDGDLTRRLYRAEPMSNKTKLYGLDVEYDFGWARLNSISSAQDTAIDARSDVTPVYAPLLAAARLPVESAGLTVAVAQHRVSQELRLTSRADRSLEWLAGFYMTRERGSQDGGMDGTLPGGAGKLALLVSSLPSSYREAAGYGDITWHATPALALTGGLRVAHNSQRYSDISSGLLVGAPSNTPGNSSETSTTYLATAKYALSPLSNVYFRAASGYRPGGPNGLKPNADPAVVKASFKSDSLWSYELGYKADLLERRLSLEAALYDIEWRDLQQTVSSGGFTYGVNAGNARVRGAELTLKWAPSKDWRFNLATTAIDARLTEAAKLGAPAGTRLPVTARFSLSAAALYSFSVAQHTAYAGVSATYAGKRDAGYAGSTVLRSFPLPAYTQVDLQAGVDLGPFNLAAYVRNLGDRRGIVYVGLAGAGFQQVTVIQPRTIGMTLSVPF